MKKSYDIAIIGGGASGLMCASFLDTQKFSVVIIDKDPLGKKLLVTGNGRCNLTNKNIKETKYNTNLVKPIIESFDVQETLEFFKKIGIETFFDEEGRCYPRSETAKDVKDALIYNLKNIDFLKDEVLSLNKNDNFEIFLSSNEKILAKKVIMACGNKNIKSILKGFDLSFEENRNILTGFEVENFDKKLMGVRENATVRVKDFDFCENGQVQFRKDGISGIVIFNLSAVAKTPFSVSLEFLPEIPAKELKNLILYRKSNCDNLRVKDVFLGLIKEVLADFILKRCKIKDFHRKLSQITEKEIDLLVKEIKDCSFVCKKTYEDCQVLSGGVDIKNLNNLESKIKGLYFCGEATNVYGPCGGYNLQWAFSSGRFVAMQLNKVLK